VLGSGARQGMAHRVMTGKGQIKEEGSKLKAEGDRFKTRKKQLFGFLPTPTTKSDGNRFNVDIF
jgi:hypothetical protein